MDSEDFDDVEMEQQDVEESIGNGPNKEALECDFSAYVLFHEGRTGAPCLSFDIVKDELGDNRTCDTPVTCYFVAGSQAARSHVNCITLMKMSNMCKIRRDDEDDDDDDDNDDDEDDDNEEGSKKDLPVIASASAKHNGCVNRIRATTINNNSLCSTWSETGYVYIWDMSRMVEAVNDTRALEAYKQDPDAEKPLFTFRGHTSEGFAIDWAPTMPGTLATGDCNGLIHVWKPGEGGTWAIDSRPFTSHTSSVEDIQWSPNEPHVFASCSVDKTIKIWDERATPNKACQITISDAHNSDINVLHWNRNEPYIASGGDDGRVLIWDLRQLGSQKAVAELAHHSCPVTTVEWSPNDGSVVASGGEDHQILQWDLAVEKDPDADQSNRGEGEDDDEEEELPQQLLFVHKGQQDIKELHWHPQVPGLTISTAHSGFNIFKTISC